MKIFSERVTVVTGAGSGVGRATALALADRECHLALVDIDEVALEQTRATIGQRSACVTTHVVDVSDRGQMEELTDDVRRYHGRCHILINNAGVLLVGRFAEDSLDDISWIVGINIWGVVHGCHLFLPMLLEADEAHIVNVSSMAGLLGIPQNSAYSLTKGAVRSFSEALRSELVGTNVGVSTLFPGAMGTNIMKGARGSQAPRLAQFGEAWFTRYVSRSPEAAARQIVRAIKYNHARVLLGPECRVVDMAARIVPGRSGLVGRALDLVT